jgi:ATP-binding cassette subfamily F protein 3
VLIRNPNFLILDEPTNDLDIVTLNVLESFLMDFPGCLLVVSHDRYFVDDLATRILEVDDGKVESYIGNYENFLCAKQKLGDSSHRIKRVEQHIGKKLESESITDKEIRIQAHIARKEQQRREQKRQRELLKVESRIEQLEEKLGELEQRMVDPEIYQDQQLWHQISVEHIELKKLVDTVYRQWEELQD